MRQHQSLSLVQAITSALVVFLASALPAQVALVRHAPALKGAVEGSIQQMVAEDLTLNGGASVTGDFYVPGTPTVQLNGNPGYGGTLDGAGSASPTNYKIALNGSVSLGHVVRRTNATPLPVVAPPPSPAGTRSVALNVPSDSPGDFTTLKNLTLSSNVGQIVVPPGNYGNFKTNAGSGFVLGVAGASTHAQYSFQSLTLSNGSSFQIVGPVAVSLSGDFSSSITLGSTAHPEWLRLRISGGGLTIAGQRVVYAHLEAPEGILTLNGGSQFIGSVAVDRLTVNGNAVLRILAPPSANHSPAIHLTSPEEGKNYPVPATFELAATATDSDGTVSKVEFFEGTTSLGEDTVAPFTLPLILTSAGSYTYFARATDNHGATADSSRVTVIVTSPNQPPTITLASPVDGTLRTAPTTIELTATASDADGTIARVEFYQDEARLGEDLAAPYEFTVPSLPAGTFVFSARAYDNLNTAAFSNSSTITVVNPNQAPTVLLTAPTDSSIFILPTDLTLAATATDYDGTISKVEFYQGTLLLGEDVTAPYTFLHAITQPGTYNFLARALDNLGSASDSAPVTVLVKDNPAPSLPFLAGFEVGEGYLPGHINGQKGWTASSPSVVTDADASSGAQSVLLPGHTPPLALAHAFSAHPAQSVAFVDLFTLPQAAADEAASIRLATLNAAHVAIVRSGTMGNFYVFNGNGTGGGSWQAALASIPVDAGGYALDWVRVTLRIDYIGKKWDLYVDGRLVAADLGLAQDSQTDLGAFSLVGQAMAPTLMDEFLAAFSNPIFTDDDLDGMDDTWETAHGLNPALNDRQGDLDGDGRTNIREYLLGTDPDYAGSDGDSLPDEWELFHFGDTAHGPGEDLDADGLTNFQEFQSGANPTNPDTDSDGVNDGRELQSGRNPTKGTVPDTTGVVNLRLFQPATFSP